jgi:hypothetical protein
MKKHLLFLCIGMALAAGLFADALNEGFEGTWPPTDWTNSGWELDTYGSPHSGDHFAYSDYATTTTLTTPSLFPTDGDNTFSFWYCTESSSYLCDLEVYVNGNLEWSETGFGSTYQQANVDLSGYNNSAVSVEFKYDMTSYYGGVCLDDVSGPELYVPEFPAPTALVATDITQTTANLGWTENGEATSWNIEWGEAGFTLGEGTLISGVTANPYNLSGLTAETSYEFYVQTTDPSDWSAVGSFTTTAAPVTEFPFIESFDGDTFAPSGWSNTKTAGSGSPGTWDRQTSGSSPSCSPHSGAGMARYNCYSLSTGTTAELVTKPINFPSDNFRVKFWMYRDTGYPSNAELVNVYYNTSATATDATLLGTVNRSTTLDPVVATTGWYEYTYGMPTGAGGDGRYLIFEAVSAYGNNIFIDDVRVEEIPSNPVFAITPASKDFGTVNINQTSDAQTFTISNTGAGTLTINSVGITGDNADQFSLTDANSYAIGLGAGESITVDVAFVPTSAGAKAADLSIESSADVTYTAALSGTGFDPSIYSFPYNQNFDAVTAPDMPADWSVLNDTGNSYSDVTTNNSTSYAHSGTNSVKFYNSGALTGNLMLISPPTALATSTTRVKFWARSSSGTQNLKVGTMTDPTLGDTFTEIQSVEVTGTYAEYTVNLAAGDTGRDRDITYVAFKHGMDGTYDYFYFDDFTWEEIPSNPVFAVSPTSKDFGTVNINQTSDAQTFTISNTGAGTLTIDSVGLTGDNADQFSLTDANSYAIDLGAGESITVDVAFAPTSAGAKTANLHIVDALTETAHDVALTGDGWDPNSGGGGAAQGNYYFANSQASGAPSAPVYNWIDISTTGTEVYADLSGGDGFAGGAEGYDIGFDFNFFGVNYDKFWIAADGFISLGSDHDAYTNQNIPSTATPNNLIALFWDDLNPSSMPGTSYLYYQSVDGKLIVTYDHFYNYSSATATKWFTGQVILYQNGNIKLQYKEKGADLVQNSCTVGIENADGTQGVNYLYNGVGGEIYPSAKAGEIAIAFGQDEGALPVTLTSFTATVAQKTTANIQWTVESESGLVGYYVYRSESDLLHASAISEMIQADNTPFSHSYSFIDNELEYEHTYNYWLESVASDGSTNQWGPQQIVLEGAPAPQLPEVTALGNNYPNPFNPVTVLKLNVKENEEGKLEIFNAKGQVVLKKTFAPGYHEYQWDAQGNASGLYFYRLSSPSYKAVKKMMLLK